MRIESSILCVELERSTADGKPAWFGFEILTRVRCLPSLWLSGSPASPLTLSFAPRPTKRSRSRPISSTLACSHL